MDRRSRGTDIIIHRVNILATIVVEAVIPRASSLAAVTPVPVKVTGCLSNKADGKVRLNRVMEEAEEEAAAKVCKT